MSPVKITSYRVSLRETSKSRRRIFNAIMNQKKCDVCGLSLKKKHKTSYADESLLRGGDGRAWCTRRCLQEFMNKKKPLSKDLPIGFSK